MIPSRLTQFVTPVTSENLLHELKQSWNDVGDIDFSLAQDMTLHNLYVRSITEDQLLTGDDVRKVWDDIDFSKKESSVRKKSVRWNIAQPALVSGFCLSWSCELVPGVELRTHPWAPATHWEQIYLPIPQVMKLEKGDQLKLEIESDTRPQTGLRIQWYTEHKRGNEVIGESSSDMRKGFLA